MDKRPALGKGLSALIPDAPEPRAEEIPSKEKSAADEDASDAVREPPPPPAIGQPQPDAPRPTGN